MVSASKVLVWFLTFLCLVSGSAHAQPRDITPTVARIAIVGDSTPGLVGDVFNSFGVPCVSQNSVVVFWGSTAGGTAGIWQWTSQNGLRLVVSSGSAAPGTLGVFGAISERPTINASGKVAFRAIADGLAGVWIADISTQPATLTLIAQSGQLAVGDEYFGNMLELINSPVGINSLGNIVFDAPSVIFSDSRQAVWYWNASTNLFVRVAREGAVPINPAGNVPTATVSRINGFSINSLDQIAISLNCLVENSDPAEFYNAIWRGYAGNPSLVLQTGANVYGDSLELPPHLLPNGNVGYYRVLPNPGGAQGQTERDLCGITGFLNSLIVQEGQSAPGVISGGVFGSKFSPTVNAVFSQAVPIGNSIGTVAVARPWQAEVLGITLNGSGVWYRRVNQNLRALFLSGNRAYQSTGEYTFASAQLNAFPLEVNDNDILVAQAPLCLGGECDSQYPAVCFTSLTSSSVRLRLATPFDTINLSSVSWTVLGVDLGWSPLAVSLSPQNAGAGLSVLSNDNRTSWRMQLVGPGDNLSQGVFTFQYGTTPPTEED